MIQIENLRQQEPDAHTGANHAHAGHVHDGSCALAGDATPAQGHRDGPVPVWVITGFLGSGKTTLVNRLLKDAALSQAAVVVGEYGEVGVDHVLIEAPSKRVRLVDSGCICGHVHLTSMCSTESAQYTSGRDAWMGPHR